MVGKKLWLLYAVICSVLFFSPHTSLCENWSAIISNTDENLNGVWGSSGSDFFAVGASGTIMHYDGTAWNNTNSGTSVNLSGVWGSSGNDVFAVGSNGTILHYDGAGWSPMFTNTTQSFLGIWGSSGSDVFAVGSNGTIFHYDGVAWSPMLTNTTRTLLSVWGSSGSDVYAGGYDGELIHYDGSSWSPAGVSTSHAIRGIWGSSSDYIFAVTSYTTILHYNGIDWFGLVRFVGNAIWGSAWNDIYSVHSSYVYHYDGYYWSKSQITSTTPYPFLRSVWGSADGKKFAVGDYGSIVTYGPGLIVELIVDGTYTSTDENGKTVKFNVKLTDEPLGVVAVPVMSSDETEAVVDKALLTFDSANYDLFQVVTVTGVNDDIDDDTQMYEILFGPTSSTAGDYEGLIAKTKLENFDNDYFPPPPPEPDSDPEPLITDLDLPQCFIGYLDFGK